MNNGCSLSTGRVANSRPSGSGHSTSRPPASTSAEPTLGTTTPVSTDATAGEQERQRIGLAAQLGPGPGTDLAVLALPHERGAAGGRHRVPVEAVVGQVEPAAGEPLRPWDPVGDVEHLVVGLGPLEV